MKEHPSPLLQQGIIRRGAGKGQIWTTCSHPECATNGSTGLLISTDLMPVLAQASADRHLAEHQRADKAN
jgi:hypothetical protein